MTDPKSAVLPLHHSAVPGAEGGSRTHTGVAPQQFLRLPRLPFRHFGATGSRQRGVSYADSGNRRSRTRNYSQTFAGLSRNRRQTDPQLVDDAANTWQRPGIVFGGLPLV